MIINITTINGIKCVHTGCVGPDVEMPLTAPLRMDSALSTKVHSSPAHGPHPAHGYHPAHGHRSAPGHRHLPRASPSPRAPTPHSSLQGYSFVAPSILFDHNNAVMADVLAAPGAGHRPGRAAVARSAMMQVGWPGGGSTGFVGVLWVGGLWPGSTGCWWHDLGVSRLSAMTPP